MDESSELDESDESGGKGGGGGEEILAYGQTDQSQVVQEVLADLKSQIYAFFSLNLEKFTSDRKFLHRHVCGVCDKYEACSMNLFFNNCLS